MFFILPQEKKSARVWKVKALVNKKAGHNYELLESFEAGLKLLGTEVKSVKSGRFSFEGAYVLVRSGEAFLINASIPPYQRKNAPQGFDERRVRKLLFNKKELSYLQGKSQEKGLTLLPIRVYTMRGNLKVEVCLARTKKKWDKRDALKRRAIERDTLRKFKK
jgi:SsrA-binding protein